MWAPYRRDLQAIPVHINNWDISSRGTRKRVKRKGADDLVRRGKCHRLRGINHRKVPHHKTLLTKHLAFPSTCCAQAPDTEHCTRGGGGASRPTSRKAKAFNSCVIVAVITASSFKAPDDVMVWGQLHSMKAWKRCHSKASLCWGTMCTYVAGGRPRSYFVVLGCLQPRAQFLSLSPNSAESNRSVRLN